MIGRNAAMLPAYSLTLGLIVLFGYMARAVPAVNADVKASSNGPQLSVPLLFEHMFPSWFAGVADSAIVIGALVPVAIMSIAAAFHGTDRAWGASHHVAEPLNPIGRPGRDLNQI